MTRARRIGFRLLATLGAAAVLLGHGRVARAADAESAPSLAHAPLEPLVPELADQPYRLAPGNREFLHRVSVSPGWGTFGSDRLFALRLAYNPNAWLGYEAAIGHDAGTAVHALLHTVSAVVRRPLPGRIQPYGTLGYGMIVVFPGLSVNAAPVTKNALTWGGGVELYLRSDLAVRGDLRQATVFGRQRDREGIVAYDYLEGTIGLAFYRSVRP